MIELIVLDYLKKNLSVPVVTNRDTNLNKYVYVEKIYNTGKHIHTCNIAVQSYGENYTSTLKLNEEVKSKLLNIIELDEISKCELVNDYVFNDLVRNKHRYQAIFEIVYY